MKRLLLSLCVSSVVSLQAFAINPLPLSESDIQRLQTYLPKENENASLVWKGNPLFIPLLINGEKRIIFPEPIEANLNGALSSDQLRIINNDQSLYLKALKPFDATRIYVTLKNSNKILLVDLKTSDKASSATSTIKLASIPKEMNTPSRQVKSLLGQSISNYEAPDTAYPASSVGLANDYVGSLRFAWQQLYAPKRLLNNPSDFVRTPMHTEQWVPDLVYGDKVLAHPEVSWASGNLYVTAVELRNKYPHPTTLNLKHDLCGEWQAAALYPRNQLKPAGSKQDDSTTLFLISPKPFGDMLGECHGSA